MLYFFNKKTLTYKDVTIKLVLTLIFIELLTIVLCVSIMDDPKQNGLGVKIEVMSHKVTATCYRANVSECDSTPLITADGSKIDTNRVDKLRWIAISRDLEKVYKMGDSIIVEGVGEGYDGIWIIKDRMNRRFKNKIDFLISDKKQGGLFKNVKISKI